MEFLEQDCTINLRGREFTAGGAVVSPSHIIAYPGANNVLADWHGNAIGTWRVISSRPAVFFGHRSWQGSTYYYMRAKLTDGSVYSMRGFGCDMIAKGKRITA